MRLTRLRAVLFVKNIDPVSLERLMFHPNAIISSNGASLGENDFKHERNYATFTKFIKLILEKKIMPLERALVKCTSLPAKKYNIKKRGQIEEGYYADIVIFKDGRLSDVIINGQLAMEDGKVKKILAGSILKSNS